MRGAHELDTDFVAALKKSWDAVAIWPGCKDGYNPVSSHPAYGQCLVGTLAAWNAHGRTENGYTLQPGIAYGDDLPRKGVWHFQLQKKTSDNRTVMVDVTWDQFAPGTIFLPAYHDIEPELYDSIAQGSLKGDPTLPYRLGVIFANLAAHGKPQPFSPHQTIRAAQSALSLT